MTEFIDRGAVIDGWGSHEFDRTLGAYTVSCVKESDPIHDDVVEIASRIQGEDYVRSGYIEPEKLDNEGRLLDPFDSERIITHFVAHPKGTGLEAIEGSVKVHQIPPGRGLEVLAAYQYSSSSLYMDFHVQIKEAFERNPERGVVEIGGLCRIEHPTSKLVPYELIRELMQQAVRSKTDERWLITFTKKAFLPIMASFGPRVICVAGEEVRIEAPDEHVTLVPCLIDPCRLVDNLALSVNEEQNQEDKLRMLQTLILMTDGLRDDEMAPETKELLGTR